MCSGKISVKFIYMNTFCSYSYNYKCNVPNFKTIVENTISTVSLDSKFNKRFMREYKVDVESIDAQVFQIR